MVDLVIVGVLLVLVSLAVRSIRKARKKGSRCIGCPYDGCCSVAKCDKKEE